MAGEQKPLELVAIEPPPLEQRRRRVASFASDGEKKTRYSLPNRLVSESPVGYRTRVSFTSEEGEALLPLLSLERPSEFVSGPPLLDGELFDEVSLGVLSARQSTNYRGQRDVVLGPEDSARAADILATLQGRDAPALAGASHTHLVFRKPYRTPFTLLLTFIGHQPVKSLFTVAKRGWDKRFHHADDIPTIGYLPDIHLGVLADGMERAAVIASGGTRKAQVHMAPFCGAARVANASGIAELERLGGLTDSERRAGWRLGLVAQVGTVPYSDQLKLEPSLFRKVGANLLALRSERIQPGVNQEAKAAPEYVERQQMDVPDELTVQCGRAAYNAFVHWTDCDREISKDLMLLERVDVLTPGGKERLREIRRHLDAVTERVMQNIPLWADLPTAKALSRNAARGKKAFALAGQRIYIGGLDREEVGRAGIDFELALRAFGAAAARSALFAELMGCVEIPDGCDLLAGICLMAGPVNQNDIDKEFYGGQDLLCGAYPDRDPTSLLVWTLKAKTVADPIGNEEQLLNAERKGALVDLRPGPSEVVSLKVDSGLLPYRPHNDERAFGDQRNFVLDPGGVAIPGNDGTEPSPQMRAKPVWG